MLGRMNKRGAESDEKGPGLIIAIGILIVVGILVAAYFIPKWITGGHAITNLQPSEIDSVVAGCTVPDTTCGQLKILGNGRFTTCDVKEIVAKTGNSGCTNIDQNYITQLKNDCKAQKTFPIEIFYGSKSVKVNKVEECDNLS